jgi:hypothetical protein
VMRAGRVRRWWCRSKVGNSSCAGI